MIKNIPCSLQDSGTLFEVKFSMLEIYNEVVRDLLDPKGASKKGGLKVRQHPKRGFYGWFKTIITRYSCNSSFQNGPFPAPILFIINFTQFKNVDFSLIRTRNVIVEGEHTDRYIVFQHFSCVCTKLFWLTKLPPKRWKVFKIKETIYVYVFT